MTPGEQGGGKRGLMRTARDEGTQGEQGKDRRDSGER